MSKERRLAIFASGAGSNARNLLTYFSNHERIRCVGIYSNRSDAGVLDIAKAFQVPTMVLTRHDFANPSGLMQHMANQGVTDIVLAGFLWRIPAALVEAFPHRIYNIHPSLLPKYGGKGMYGHFVHEAVFAAQEAVSGITIHYVNEHYDEGAVIAQFETDCKDAHSAQEIEMRVRALEGAHFPKVIEKILLESRD
ncbi:MAG: phosphoribosylglycinamide formyltransferase [Flavobacteriales bacterium]